MRRMEWLTDGWLDPVSHDTFRVVREMNGNAGMNLEKGGKSKNWCSVAFGKNVSLCLHRDDDFTVGVVQVIGEENWEGVSEEVLAYFCFPNLRRCIAVRSCDCVVFNAGLDHCISSRVSGARNMHCVSFYMNHLIPSGKDNSSGRTKEE